MRYFVPFADIVKTGSTPLLCNINHRYRNMEKSEHEKGGAMYWGILEWMDGGERIGYVRPVRLVGYS